MKSIVSFGWSSSFWSTKATETEEAEAVGEGDEGAHGGSAWPFSLREASELITVRVWTGVLLGVWVFGVVGNVSGQRMCSGKMWESGTFIGKHSRPTFGSGAWAHELRKVF